MSRALELAAKASEEGEVPVGALIVQNGKIIGEGWNRSISTIDPTAHAEIVAMRDAAVRTGNYRLVNATLIVTLEPCLMCAGAMVHARIDRLVFGAHDPKRGAVSSTVHAFDAEELNHRVDVRGGVMEDACARLLRVFFHARRT